MFVFRDVLDMKDAFTELWIGEYSLKQYKYSIVRYSNFQFGTALFGGSDLYFGELFWGCSNFELNLANYFCRGSIFLTSFC